MLNEQTDKQFCSKNKRFASIGFTLAEILVTLTIIGVVASLTIPDLILSVQESQYIVAWKKSFSSLSQATLTMKEDNRGSLVNLFANNGYTNDFSLALATIYTKYLNASKICDMWWGTRIVGNCWHQSGGWKDLAGTLQDNAGFSTAGLILSDGSLIRIHGYANNCATMNYNVEDCGLMMIDTNGFKGPNMIGKDIYGTHITKHGLLPWGVPPGAGNGVLVGTTGDSFYRRSNCSPTDIPPNGGTVRGWTCSSLNLLK